MPSTTPPATPLPSSKRRRLDNAHATLSKPFKSPLIRKPSPTLISATSLSPPASTSASTSTNHPSKTPSKPILPPTPTSTLPVPHPHHLVTPIRLPQNRRSTSPLKPPPSELVSLQRTHATLTTTHRITTQSLATATQALALEQHPATDSAIIQKTLQYRAAARLAAEELFGTATEKVNRMGGPGGEGWREVLFKKNQWEEEEKEERRREREELREEMMERGVEIEDYEEDDAHEEDGGGKEGMEEEWGMAVMLKALGVEVGMLGWDSEMECWKD